MFSLIVETRANYISALIEFTEIKGNAANNTVSLVGHFRDDIRKRFSGDLREDQGWSVNTILNQSSLVFGTTLNWLTDTNTFTTLNVVLPDCFTFVANDCERDLEHMMIDEAVYNKETFMKLAYEAFN